MTVAAQKPSEEEPGDPRVRAERLKREGKDSIGEAILRLRAERLKGEGKDSIDEAILADGIRMGAQKPMERIKTKFDPEFVDVTLDIIAKYRGN